jgi:hypothetical protein
MLVSTQYDTNALYFDPNPSPPQRDFRDPFAIPKIEGASSEALLWDQWEQLVDG